MTARKPDATSARVAKIAAQILAASDEFAPDQEFYVRRKKGVAFRLIFADVVSMAGSLVNQAADHDERETLRKGKLPRGHKLIRRHKPITRNHKARKPVRQRRTMPE